MLETSQPEALLNSALAAVEDGDGYRAELDKILIPIYTTDADVRRRAGIGAGDEVELVLEIL